ncbi:MAG: NAD(P)-binding protein [Rhodobacteraceae bacterium]|nr:NAD(P)-binding protein [Paracoccaceae bacterium]
MTDQTITQSKPFAVTLDVGTSLLNKTGSWRTERPVYVDRLPPCNNACPAGENIQSWLGRAEEGDYEAAWRAIMDDNPLPAVMGRVCYHPCEGACNRAELDQAVGINSIERFLGDQALKNDWAVEPDASTGKKVLIIGAGPCGLSAAHHLARFGHSVTIHDANPQAGGMTRYGIPKYRLPREKLRAEVARIENMGVTIHYESRIDDVLEAKSSGGFEAVLLATGAQLPRRADIDSDGQIPLVEAVTVLRDTELDNPTALKGNVVVYGGGNTAVDVARTAIRLGAPSATLVVIEDRQDMPAHRFEIDEAVEEGVKIVNLRSIKKINGSTVTLEKMVRGENRSPQPTGEYETIEASVVVEAIGQSTDIGALNNIDGLVVNGGSVQVDPSMKTSVEGIFAGGDMVPSARTVTTAIGHGKKAARNIDAWLGETAYQPAEKHEIAEASKLNTWYYSDAPRTIRPMLDVVRRTSGFAEVVGDLTADNALFEARRCMSCGNCFECDNCYGICPDNAVTKLGPGNRFEFKYDYCKGCGICASECPCGAIKLVPEEI